MPSSSMHPIYLLGLGMPSTQESARPGLTHPVLDKADVLVGGRSQLAPFAGHPAQKLLVDADTEGLYRRIGALRAQGKLLAALCSGDPLYFGLGARLAERFGPDALRVVPGLSSMQAAAAFLGIPWENMRSISLHGRSDMLPLAHALLEEKNLCLLCDPATSPARIAAWMLERGCSGYAVHLLENLRLGPDGAIIPEGYARHDLQSAAALPHDERSTALALIILERTQEAPASDEMPHPGAWSRPFGIDDSGLEKDRGVFTKLPVRAAGLGALGVEPGDTLWDIGAGSGAVSIDAARLAWRGQVFAIEGKGRRVAHLFANRRAFGAPNMEIVPEAFPACLEATGARPPLPRPHKIFVGGGLGGDPEDARELLRKAWAALLPGGRLLAHCVLLSSLGLARSTLHALAGKVEIQSIQASVSAAVGDDMQLKALNPVFLILARKSGKLQENAG